MAQTYIYKGRFKNTSDILYTWDGKHLYKGRFTNTNVILYTFDGKYLYKGRFTNINDVLYSVHGKNVYFRHSCVSGGSGIRTPVTLTSKAVFKTAAFDRSAKPPIFIICFFLDR